MLVSHTSLLAKAASGSGYRSRWGGSILPKSFRLQRLQFFYVLCVNCSRVIMVATPGKKLFSAIWRARLKLGSRIQLVMCVVNCFIILMNWSLPIMWNLVPNWVLFWQITRPQFSAPFSAVIGHLNRITSWGVKVYDWEGITELVVVRVRTAQIHSFEYTGEFT